MKIDVITQEEYQEIRSLLIEIRDLILNKNQHDAPVSNWLKSAQVKKILDCSSGTLVNMRINGTIQSKKIGGTWYYSKPGIDKMLSSKK